MQVMRKDGTEAYFYPAIMVEVTRKGKAWMAEQDRRLNEDEDPEDCVLLDVLGICKERIVQVPRTASISGVTRALRAEYREEYGDTCGPKQEHIAYAFKHGYIRFVLANCGKR